MIPRFRPVHPAADAALLHAWVTHPRSAYWQMGEADVDGVRAAYAEIDSHPAHDAWVGELDGEAAVLCETYDPARSELAGLVGRPELAAGDVGMHVLVAPPAGALVPGHTRRVFAAVMRHCFVACGASRVVVEPDVDNTAIARINAEAGFEVLTEIDLPGKTAALSTCTPAAFAASPIGRLP